MSLPSGALSLKRALVRLRLDVFNLSDVKSYDIACFNASGLPGEPPEGVDDSHFHPAERRLFRSTASLSFWEGVSKSTAQRVRIVLRARATRAYRPDLSRASLCGVL